MAASLASSALAATVVTYTATETIAVPPASSYAGSAGGDGWGLAFSDTQVFNVFHHQTTLQVACHEQSDASQCWDPRTITDLKGNDFSSSGQPGINFDHGTGRLYVFATRTSDRTGGVVCIDTTRAATNPNPFCGFTALTAREESPIASNSAISEPAEVGSKWYAFNYVTDNIATGAKNKLLCFDLTTRQACTSQPFALTTPRGTFSNDDRPSPAVVAIAGRVIVPIHVGEGSDQLACFDPGTRGNCAGRWPVTLALTFQYNSTFGAGFPLLDRSGTVRGLCLPADTLSCYSLSGAHVATPAGMATAITATTPWDGPAVVLGPRVYVPNGNLPNENGSDGVQCYDANTRASCTNFPRLTPGSDYLYTVTADPQRPTCLWVNSDSGDKQIQNFDAFTGGACSNDNLRFVASRVIVDTPTCQPASYTSLQVTVPRRASYRTGTVEFDDADATRIPGQSDAQLDHTGSVNLSGRNLNTATGLPQFLITLAGHRAAIGSVTVKLVWTGRDDPSCVKPGTVRTGPPTSSPPTKPRPPTKTRSITAAPPSQPSTAGPTSVPPPPGPTTGPSQAVPLPSQAISAPTQPVITPATTPPSTLPTTTPTTPPTSPPRVITRVPNGLKLSTPSVNPGGSLAASGSGCPADSTVALSIDGKSVGHGTADGNGNFDVAISTPNLPVGNHTVTATCGNRVLTSPVSFVYVTGASSAPTARALTVGAVLAFFLLFLGLALRRPGVGK